MVMNRLPKNKATNLEFYMTFSMKHYFLLLFYDVYAVIQISRRAGRG